MAMGRDQHRQPGATREGARVKVHNAADRKRIRSRASLGQSEFVPADVYCASACMIIASASGSPYLFFAEHNSG